MSSNPTPDPFVLSNHDLGGGHLFRTGRLPPGMMFDATMLAALWALHPAEYHKIMMHGRLVETPRWQQAYVLDYHYTGRDNTALPLPDILRPLWDWVREAIDGRLQGTLINWYEPELEHYIGAHRDSRTNMIKGAPIVTISLGAERVFRIRPWKKKGAGYRDFPATDGTVFVMPYETNLAFTHEVPHTAKSRGRRMSVTMRAFHEDGVWS